VPFMTDFASPAGFRMWHDWRRVADEVDHVIANLASADAAFNSTRRSQELDGPPLERIRRHLASGRFPHAVADESDSDGLKRLC
jgi:hypothetical protein